MQYHKVSRMHEWKGLLERFCDGLRITDQAVPLDGISLLLVDEPTSLKKELFHTFGGIGWEKVEN
jgi:hypothetical protein